MMQKVMDEGSFIRVSNALQEVYDSLTEDKKTIEAKQSAITTVLTLLAERTAWDK